VPCENSVREISIPTAFAVNALYACHGICTLNDEGYTKTANSLEQKFIFCTVIITIITPTQLVTIQDRTQRTTSTQYTRKGAESVGFSYFSCVYINDTFVTSKFAVLYISDLNFIIVAQLFNVCWRSEVKWRKATEISLQKGAER
jgi:hypothetical protein